MKRIGINGNLIDAVFKSRILQSYPEKSVHLILTPCCKPLLSFFQRVKSVKTIAFDEGAVYCDGHGEQSAWTIPVDVDMTYPAYPSEWVINYVASYSSLPKISRKEWFGSYRYLLPDRGQPERAIYFEASVASDMAFLSRFRDSFPDVRICVGNCQDDLMHNMHVASLCESRIVPFGAEMALMAALGLDCIVNYGSARPGHYTDLFRSYGESIVCSADLFAYLHQRLSRKDAFAPPTRTAPCDTPRLAICIPTLCCGDLLEESTAVLHPQLSDNDAILIIDNGAQQLRSRLEHSRIQVIEPSANLGVAGSWNRFIKETLFNPFRTFDWVLILNDDVRLRDDQLNQVKEELAKPEHRDKWMVVGPQGWSIFAINRQCIEHVGFFDENFFPAYFEDNDFHYRMNLIDPSRYAAVGAPFTPEVVRHSVTIARLPHINRSPMNHAYYIQKWGGSPGQETFKVPFGTEPCVTNVVPIAEAQST